MGAIGLDHLLFWLPSKANSSLETIFFLGMMKFFDTFRCARFFFFEILFQKKNVTKFSSLKPLYHRCPYFVNEINEIWTFDPARGIFRQSKPWYWFYRCSSSSTWCSNCTNTLVDDGDIQRIRNKFWCEWILNLLFLEILCKVLVSWQTEVYIATFTCLRILFCIEC